MVLGRKYPLFLKAQAAVEFFNIYIYFFYSVPLHYVEVGNKTKTTCMASPELSKKCAFQTGQARYIEGLKHEVTVS